MPTTLYNLQQKRAGLQRKIKRHTDKIEALPPLMQTPYAKRARTLAMHCRARALRDLVAVESKINEMKE